MWPGPYLGVLGFCPRESHLLTQPEGRGVLGSGTGRQAQAGRTLFRLLTMTVQAVFRAERGLALGGAVEGQCATAPRLEKLVF